MVTVAQLALTQSPISALIPSVGNTVTVKLDDSNYVTWNFQMGLLLEGNGIFGFVDGSIPCPDKYHSSEDETVTTPHTVTDDYKVWKIHDKALMTLITATLSTAAISCVIGCRSSQEMWSNMRERFSNMTRTSIVQMKIDLQNIKKGSESIDLYLQRIKDCRDQLAAVGVHISDEDIIIVALKGLPTEFNTIKTVIRGRENLVSLKELRSQLKAEEVTLEEVIKQAPIMSAMYASNSIYDVGGSSGGVSHSVSQNAFPGSSQPMLQSMPVEHHVFPMHTPLAFVSQGGSGTYNNFRGTNFNSKGKGKKFYTHFQQPQQSGAPFQKKFYTHLQQPQQPGAPFPHQSSSPQSSFQSSHSPVATEQVYQPVQPCQICNRKGHSALNCFQTGCQICNRKGHTAATCFDRNSGPPSNFSPQQFPPSGSPYFSSPQNHFSSPFPSAPVVNPAMVHSHHQSPIAMTARSTSSPSAPQSEYWLLDSGATHHMTSDLSNLQVAAPYSSSDTVTGANGSGLHIAHIGQSTISLPTNNLCLTSVLHVPQLSQHLLSMHQLCKDNNCRCIVDEFSVCIQDKVTQKVLYHGLSNNVVYPLPVLKSSSVSPAAYIGQRISSALWHCRMGHPANAVLKAALSKADISLSCKDSSPICKACLQGKFTSLPFPSLASKSVIPFEVIHTDVWGPSPSVSIEHYRYYVSFIDECTRYTWIFPLMNKAAVFGLFVQFQAFVQNYFNASIRILQSDGGGEYVGFQFQNFLKNKGILHHKSCPYTPQQNGLAERKNRHITETAITLLQQASLPPKFWYHACATAVYLINRMPTPVLSMQSPYEKLYNSSPKLDHLKIFGCACYPSMRPYRSHKLEPKTSECIFLGYAAQYKGFICFNPKDNKLIVSRHVLFDECQFPATFLSQHTSHGAQSVSIPTTVNPTTFHHPQLVPVPFPQVFSRDSSSLPHSTDCSPVPREHGSSSTTVSLPLDSAVAVHSAPPVSSDLNPATHMSQASELQQVSLEAVNAHPMQTRSKSGISKKKTAFSVTVHSADQEPPSYSAAYKLSHWRDAMQEEMTALIQQNTWTLVPLPPDKNLVGCKWIYKIKKHPDGTVARYKARLVAKGFSQEAGLDYYETFSPVVKPTTVRLLLSLAASNGWKLKQLDVKNAFLHGFLEEEVYMAQPQGFVDPIHPAHVCKLQRSLYGLKQAPRAWNERFTKFLLTLGFTSSYADPSLFVKHTHHSIIVLLLYVDDIILTGSSVVEVQNVINQLTTEFDMKVLGLLHYFLGLQIEYHSSGIFVHQSKYITDLLHKADMFLSKPCITPCHPNHKLLNHGSPSFSDPFKYRSLVGALQYLTFTRPDIAYSVNQVCQFMHAPLVDHFLAVKRILRYLRGTLTYGIRFGPGSLDIKAYTDADWAGDPNDRRSTTGFVVFLGANPISWSSKKQHTVSRSSTEAEYRAMATTTAEIVWIQQLLKDLQISCSSVPLLHCDNLSAMALATNPILHSKAKHIEIDCHFVRERVQQGTIMLQFVSTTEQCADVLTKGLCSSQFNFHCSNLMLGSSLHKIEGEC